MAKQNFPKGGLRGPYSGQPIHLDAATGEGASYRVAAVGCWWTASGVRGVEPVGINQGRRGRMCEISQVTLTIQLRPGKTQ